MLLAVLDERRQLRLLVVYRMLSFTVLLIYWYLFSSQQMHSRQMHGSEIKHHQVCGFSYVSNHFDNTTVSAITYIIIWLIAFGWDTLLLNKQWHSILEWFGINSPLFHWKIFKKALTTYGLFWNFFKEPRGINPKFINPSKPSCY